MLEIGVCLALEVPGKVAVGSFDGNKCVPFAELNNVVRATHPSFEPGGVLLKFSCKRCREPRERPGQRSACGAPRPRGRGLCPGDGRVEWRG